MSGRCRWSSRAAMRTDPRDHGRPVILVASALGVTARRFSRGVQPGASGGAGPASDGRGGAGEQAGADGRARSLRRDRRPAQRGFQLLPLPARKRGTLASHPGGGLCDDRSWPGDGHHHHRSRLRVQLTAPWRRFPAWTGRNSPRSFTSTPISRRMGRLGRSRLGRLRQAERDSTSTKCRRRTGLGRLKLRRDVTRLIQHFLGKPLCPPF